MKQNEKRTRDIVTTSMTLGGNDSFMTVALFKCKGNVYQFSLDYCALVRMS